MFFAKATPLHVPVILPALISALNEYPIISVINKNNVYCYVVKRYYNFGSFYTYSYPVAY